MSKREKRLEDKLAQANDALLMAREALGTDDGPFIDDAIRKLKSDLLDARTLNEQLSHGLNAMTTMRDVAERERDEARKALEWVWDHFDCRAFQSDAYHGDPVPDWIVELVQRLWAARAAAKGKGGGDG